MKIDLFEISPKAEIERSILVKVISCFLNISSEKVMTHDEFWLLPENKMEKRQLALDILYNEDDEYKVFIRGIATFEVGGELLAHLAAHMVKELQTDIVIGDYTAVGPGATDCFLLYHPDGRIMKAIDVSKNGFKIKVVGVFTPPEDEDSAAISLSHSDDGSNTK